MILDKKRQLIEELLSHLDHSQGMDLGKMIDASKNSPTEDMGMDGKPKALSIEKIEVMKPKGEHDSKVDDAISSLSKGGSPEGSPEEEALESPEEEAKEPEEPGEENDHEKLTDEELAELLKQYIS